MATDVAPRLREALTMLAPEHGLVCAWLFGSQATDRATARSDADVAVMFESSPDLDRRIELADALTVAVGRTVDLVDVERSSPILMRQVLRDGLLLLDRDRFRRLMFECVVPSRYRDQRRFRRRSEETLSEPLHRA